MQVGRLLSRCRTAILNATFQSDTDNDAERRARKEALSREDETRAREITHELGNTHKQGLGSPRAPVSLILSVRCSATFRAARTPNEIRLSERNRRLIRHAAERRSLTKRAQLRRANSSFGDETAVTKVSNSRILPAR